MHKAPPHPLRTHAPAHGCPRCDRNRQGADNETNLVHQFTEDIMNVADNVFFAAKRHINNKKAIVFLDDIAVRKASFYRVDPYYPVTSSLQRLSSNQRLPINGTMI